MAFESVASTVRTAMSSAAGFEEKNMFGGVTFMINRNMAGSVNSRGLILRVGEAATDEAMAAGASAYMIGKNAVKGMVMFADPSKLSDADVEKWANTAKEVTSAMEPKPEKK